MNQPLNRYRAKVYFQRGGYFESAESNDLGPILAEAQTWADKPNVKSSQVLRADIDGVNAGKFFLHLIVK